jgi:hypothetical protein
MKSKYATQHVISSEQIAVKAHTLWQAAGSPHGRDREFWFAAERELQRGDNDLSQARREANTWSAPSALDDPIADDFEPEIPTTGGHSGRSATAL